MQRKKGRQMEKKSFVSLKELSGLKIGGIAETVFFPGSLSEFIQLLKEESLPIIVGGGSNVFFLKDKIKTVIVTKNLTVVEHLPDNSFWADCGVKLAEYFSFAAGVPATVGGGVLMNFGAFGQELASFVKAVEVFDQKLSRRILKSSELKFAYRTSSLKKEKLIVLRVLFSSDYRDNFKEYLAKRKNNIPYDYPNIGSIFKNPAENSAGYLIEQAGLKGLTVGNAMVSLKHANIIVNKGAATAADVLALITKIKEIIKEKFAVELETEIDCLGGEL